MSKQKTGLIMFGIGACGYGLIEILWRGYTHWSMLWAGGTCFMIFGAISDKIKNLSIFVKGLIGSGIITSVEFIFGIIFNLVLKKNVWDYSNMPLNIGGQICILYSLFWGVLSTVFIPFANKVTKSLQNHKRMI